MIFIYPMTPFSKYVSSLQIGYFGILCEIGLKCNWCWCMGPLNLFNQRFMNDWIHYKLKRVLDKYTACPAQQTVADPQLGTINEWIQQRAVPVTALAAVYIMVNIIYLNGQFSHHHNSSSKSLHLSTKSIIKPVLCNMTHFVWAAYLFSLVCLNKVQESTSHHQSPLSNSN